VKIKPMGITQLVEITCDSWDAGFAANFCNTLTDEFREVDLESRGDQAKRTSDWLVRQAGDIRQKAEESEQRLIAATNGNGLILTDQGNGVGEDGLRAMQSELVRAQAARMEAEARLATRRQISNQAPVANESAAYAADKLRLSDLQTQVAALVPPLTEANPRIVHLRSEIRQVESNLDKETLESDERLQNEYTADKHREALIASTYRALEGHVSSDLQKSSEVDLLRREVQSEQQLYQTLLQRAKEAGFASAMPASTIRVVDPAKVPSSSALPQRLRTALIGFFLGAFGGVILAFFKERSAVLLRMPGDSERLVNTDELGVIPSALVLGGPLLRSIGLSSRGSRAALTSGPAHLTLHTAGWDDDLSLVAEAYRNTTISILNAQHKDAVRSYVISSPSAGEGKTTITCNIGVALSKARLRVVLVDGDLRKPSLHKAFSIPNITGLRQVLGGEKLLISDFCHPTEFDRLSVVPAGSGSATTVELLHSGEFGALIKDLSREFDVVLVDTPPMLHMADARMMAREVEGAILVFRSGVTTREDALTARLMLSRDRIQVVGSILNDFNPRAAGKSGYYDSYSAYRRNSQGEHARARS
jgi:succinoglycan biosynthesis transport protein ExoP